MPESESEVWLGCPDCPLVVGDVDCDWREATQDDMPEEDSDDGIMIAVCPECGADLQVESVGE